MMDVPLSHSKYQDEYIIKMKIVCYNIGKYQYEYVILHVHCNNENKLNIWNVLTINKMIQNCTFIQFHSNG